MTNSLFLKALRREAVDVTPVWLMRQAGRYQVEYRTLREKVGFLELCKDPALCTEVMVRAVDQLGVDAAIIFSDLLLILEPMGLELEYAEGGGPLFHNPIRSAADVERVRELETAEPLSYVSETVRMTKQALHNRIPVIGFAGAPFTLAAYAIEGGVSRNYAKTKRFMVEDEGAWHALLEKIARAVVVYLNAQIAAGADAVQLFDSWAGCLSPDDYRRYAMPYTRAIFDNITAVPSINFATGNPELLPLLSEAGGDAIGLDWRVRLDAGWQRVGPEKAVQGNLDPVRLLGSADTLRAAVRDILDQAAGRSGHIFNLGHGVLPQTPVENARAVVEMVHEESGRVK